MKSYTAKTKITKVYGDAAEFCPLYGFDKWAGNVGDSFVSIEIKRWVPRRSLSQNALWHSMLHIIAMETGNDIETIKEYIKTLWGVRIDFRGVSLPKPSHCYTSAEWDILISSTVALAGDLGIKLPM